MIDYKYYAGRKFSNKQDSRLTRSSTIISELKVRHQLAYCQKKLDTSNQ